MAATSKSFLLHDFLEAGRAGYIDFGQVAADDIQTGKQNTATLQFRRKGFCNFTVAARSIPVPRRDRRQPSCRVFRRFAEYAPKHTEQLPRR